MILCALAGGPVASTAYIVALQMAGSVIIPITALCPAIGAILGHFIFKQRLTPRMVVGVFVCVGASIMIGSTSFGGDAAPGVLAGCLIALVAAFGWGVEGCIAGFGTTLIDYEIGITIRQVTSGLSNLVILVPIISLLASFAAKKSSETGHLGATDGIGATEFIGGAFSDGPAMLFFVISGFFALFAFSLWYKGNSMCGAALGMACNGAYSFWGPFFCWIVLGLFFKEDGWMIAPIAWVGAVVMFFGILLIAVNPFAPLMKKIEVKVKPPLNYAILLYLAKHGEGDADTVMEALAPEYGHYRIFKKPSVIESLMTSKENGILEEVRAELSGEGEDELRVWYTLTDYGKGLIQRFL
jgi:drug/metabolite transporter (DMT)-like permease